MPLSIRSVLLYGFCGLLALSLIAVGGTGVYSTARNTLELGAERSQIAMDLLELHFAGEFEPIERQARAIAAAVAADQFASLESPWFEAYLHGALASTPGVVGLAVLGPDGRGLRVRRGGAGASRVDWSDDPETLRALERVAAQTGPAWAEPIWVEPLGQPAVNLRTPLRSSRGVFLGALIQIQTVADLSRHLAALTAGEAITPFLLYEGRFVLAHPALADGSIAGSDAKPLPTLADVRDPAMAAFASRRQARIPGLQQNGGLDVGVAEVGEARLVYVARSLDWTPGALLQVGAYFDREQIAGVQRRLQAPMIVGLVVLLLAMAAAIAAARYTTRSIGALARASHQVAEGDLHHLPPVPRSRIRELDEAARAFERMVAGLRDRERIRAIFGRMVPASVAERILSADGALAPQTATATVLFSDIAGFTKLAERMEPDTVVAMLNAYFSDMTAIIERHGGVITQFQGDAILAVFNVPAADPNHAREAVAAALEMREALRTRRYDGRRLSVRFGVNTGPLVAGNVGASDRLSYTVHGDAVNLAARLEAYNKQVGGDILISATTAEALQGAPLIDLGEHHLPGRAAPVTLYTVADEVEDGAAEAARHEDVEMRIAP
eukprot:g1168.t1